MRILFEKLNSVRMCKEEPFKALGVFIYVFLRAKVQLVKLLSKLLVKKRKSTLGRQPLKATL